MNSPPFRYACFLLLVPVFAGLLDAKTVADTCGTYPARGQEELDLHRKYLRRAGKPATRAAGAPAALSVSGNLMILEDSDGVVAQRNPFNLDGRSVTFTRGATGYTFATRTGGYESAAAEGGTPLTGLGDDDTRQIQIGFSFPYFGKTYDTLWVNSDGNLTFTEGDSLSANRSLGRLNAGLPRIAPLYSDLDPSLTANGVRVTREASRLIVSWVRVREYSDSGTGALTTFQVKLSLNGSIEMSWNGVTSTGAVVGISPGGLLAPSSIVSFTTGSTTEYPGAIAERFGDTNEVDLVTASQKVMAAQEDAYDYLAFFNTTGTSPGAGVIAYEVSVRARRKGIGDTLGDAGSEYGSAHRLQAVLNMGTLSQFPADPNGRMLSRGSTGDTGLTVVGHEAGHLFLSYVSVHDGDSLPMLGRQLFHWAFTFNSEASLLEGNRIVDNGAGASPRFRTTATVEGFSPLDQYLMGLRPSNEVPTTFYVQTPGGYPAAATAPQVGITFNGTRHDVNVRDLTALYGRRTPDDTVEQRRYRIGFVLIVPAGTTPLATDLAKLDLYRQEFVKAWDRYSGGRGQMDASVARNLRLSVEPAAGVLAGRTFPATVSIDHVTTTPTNVVLRTDASRLAVPAGVTIPAGATSATFSVTGLSSGVEVLHAEGPAGFLTVEARVQVLPEDGSGLSVVLENRDDSKILFRVQDANELPYPGLVLTGGGQTVTTTDEGRATFTPAGTAALRVTVNGTAISGFAGAAQPPALARGGIVNAASYQPGLVAGGIATLFGTALYNAEVQVNSTPAQVFYSSDGQINFSVPSGLTGSTVAVSARTSLGTATATVPLLRVQPGIFFDPVSGFGAVIDRGQRIFEVYGTGFGPATAVTAVVGTAPATVLYSGLAPGFIGLQQVNVQAAAAVPAGPQDLTITADSVASNTVKIQLQP